MELAGDDRDPFSTSGVTMPHKSSIIQLYNAQEPREFLHVVYHSMDYQNLNQQKNWFQQFHPH